MKWDILIPIIIYILGLFAIGAWAFLRKKNAPEGGVTAEYYIGGRTLGPVVLVFTLLASAASAGTFIGVPGLAYQGGHAWVLVFLFQAPAAFITLAILGKKFAILSRKHNFVTITDFLRHRFESKAVTAFASLGIVLFLVAYMVAQFVGGARLLVSITGVSYPVLIVAFAGVVALYTGFGGFMADAISDTVQGVIMLAGGVVLWVAVLVVLGGTTPMAEQLAGSHPDLGTLPGPSGIGLGDMFAYSLQFGLLLFALPHVAIRAMSYRDSKTAHLAMWTGPLIMAIFTLGFGAMGVTARVFFPDLDIVDLAVPNMVVDTLPGALAGALLAAPLAAIMSTVDSMILVVSGTIVRDVYMEYFKPNLSDRRASNVGTLVSILIGVIVLVLALRPPDALQYLVVFAIAGLQAVFAVPLVGGLYWRRANALGAMLSMVGGVAWYIASTQWFPAMAMGILPIVNAMVVAVLLFVLGGYLGSAPPRHVLVKFWGTQAEIDRLGAVPQGGVRQ
ncbi:sodium/pantothenate symporter [Ornithinimicrobium cavernae]|uniref:sodium/pantothenate symporter n=1 Tax=Ornithinimicrobium cavernae TaxID=2666047 RepID=UPI000D68AA9F|nr:sodium/pantothenate symporter [Ornithinimicrobium cavernae]